MWFWRAFIAIISLTVSYVSTQICPGYISSSREGLTSGEGDEERIETPEYDCEEENSETLRQPFLRLREL